MTKPKKYISPWLVSSCRFADWSTEGAAAEYFSLCYSELVDFADVFCDIDLDASKKIRFHITPNAKGEWRFDRHEHKVVYGSRPGRYAIELYDSAQDILRLFLSRCGTNYRFDMWMEVEEI